MRVVRKTLNSRQRRIVRMLRQRKIWFSSRQSWILRWMLTARKTLFDIIDEQRHLLQFRRNWYHILHARPSMSVQSEMWFTVRLASSSSTRRLNCINLSFSLVTSMLNSSSSYCRSPSHQRWRQGTRQRHASQRWMDRWMYLGMPEQRDVNLAMTELIARGSTKLMSDDLYLLACDIFPELPL